jgi:hypothetical protein
MDIKRCSCEAHTSAGYGSTEGEKMYNRTLSLTLALDEGVLTPLPGPFTRGKDAVNVVQGAGWAPGQA